jgi:hypothetical protein
LWDLEKKSESRVTEIQRRRQKESKKNQAILKYFNMDEKEFPEELLEDFTK